MRYLILLAALFCASAHAFNFDITSYAGRHEYFSNEPDNRCQGFIDIANSVSVICNSKTHETQPIVIHQPMPAIGEPNDYVIAVVYLNPGRDLKMFFRGCYITLIDYDHVTATCESSTDDEFVSSFECVDLGVHGCNDPPWWPL